MSYLLFVLLFLIPKLSLAQSTPKSPSGEDLVASLAIFSNHLDTGFAILLLIGALLTLVTFGVCVVKLIRERAETRQKEVVPATFFLGALIVLCIYSVSSSLHTQELTQGSFPAQVSAPISSGSTLIINNPQQSAIRGTAVELKLVGIDFANGPATIQSTCASSVKITTASTSLFIFDGLVSDVCKIVAIQARKVLASTIVPVIDAPSTTTTLPAECTSSKANMSVTPGLSGAISAEYTPFVLCSGLPITLKGSIKLLIEKSGNIKLYSKVNTVDPVMLWESKTSTDCTNNACRLRLQSDGNLVLTKNGNPLWGSSTFGTSFSLLLSDTVPFIGIVKNHALTWSPVLGPEFKPKATPLSILGWAEKIYPDDGVLQGWAAHGKNLSENLTIKFKVDGKEVGSTIANEVRRELLYGWGLLGSYGFSFRIPDSYQDGKSHTLEVMALSNDGTTQVIQGPVSVKTFILKTRATVSWASDLNCIKPDSKCVSNGYDYDAPNFTKAQGWGDGKNYFTDWKCTSTVGINTIARLNIAPQGSHGRKFQKDSTYMNQYEKLIGGAPTVYFTTTRADFHGLFSIKKAAYDASVSQWKIYDVLDYPSSEGGFSSLDGVYPNYIMQDYSAPGLGPTSPLPGSQTKIPSVSNIPLNKENTSYALEGFGPLGITTITNFAQTPDAANGDIAGKTCVHWNPKFFNYTSGGIPQAMLIYLSLADTNKPCILPDGTSVRGTYVYRNDPKSGWQLDLTKGQVIGSDMTTVKLVWGSNNTFIGGDWDGTLTTYNIDTGKKNVVLSCQGSGAKFAEPSGSNTQIIFAAVPPGDPSAGVDPGLFNGDIFYAFKN